MVVELLARGFGQCLDEIRCAQILGDLFHDRRFDGVGLDPLSLSHPVMAADTTIRTAPVATIRRLE
ncbi:MAG TPA: hypothetical protein VL051_04570 [Burkholderiaceae bacterium]|nr:hypothetical protein [Burkholderiaceae bacterium]